MEITEIKKRIEAGLPGALVEIRDPMNDGVHLKAYVAYNGFMDKPLLEQHRMVMNLLKDGFEGKLHALALETSPDTSLS